jgi:hypothetical protein
MSIDVISLGELLIDFVSLDRDASLMDSSGFTKAPGGAPANVVAGLAKLGISSGFIGKVGEDPFGYFLKKVLDDINVDSSHLVFDKTARTTLSYVAQKSDGVRDCIFYRNPGADMLLMPEEIDEDYIKDAVIFHFGSFSLKGEPGKQATYRALEYAKKHHRIISYDPNYRSTLWDDDQEAKNLINSVDEADRYKKLDKKTKKMIRQQVDQLAGRDRRKNLYSSNRTNNGADFIIEYLNQATKGFYDDKGEYKDKSLLDIIKEDEKYEFIPPELIDDEYLANTNSIVGGRYVNAREQQKIDILKELYGLGIDVIGSYGKSMNKQSVKLIKSKIGDVEPMTKKDLKRAKKRSKKERNLIEQVRDNDRVLEKALLSNKFEFSKNGDSINCRLRDIFRD